MPLDYEIKKDRDRKITVLCMICGKAVGSKQQEDGKALCVRCDPCKVIVICSLCPNVVEDEQLKNGRCVCGFCDEAVYGATQKPRVMTVREIERQTKFEEEKQFMRMMRGMYRRVRPRGRGKMR